MHIPTLWISKGHISSLRFVFCLKNRLSFSCYIILFVMEWYYSEAHTKTNCINTKICFTVMLCHIVRVSHGINIELVDLHWNFFQVSRFIWFTTFWICSIVKGFKVSIVTIPTNSLSSLRLNRNPKLTQHNH